MTMRAVIMTEAGGGYRLMRTTLKPAFAESLDHLAPVREARQ